FRVLVLEKAPYCGGTTALSGAGLWAPANLHVLNAGQPDDLDKAFEYMTHTVGDRTPASMQHAFLDAAAPTIAWLEDKGVRFSYMTGYPDYHPDEPGGLLTGRAITPKAIKPSFLEPLEHKIQPKLPMGDGGPPIPDTGPEGPLWGGQSLIAQLLKACADAGVEVWTSAAFTDLVLTDGQVTGVKVLRDGSEIEVGVIAGVLLASGGFDHNATMRTELQHPAVGHAQWTIGVAGNTGDGITAGIKAGAATDLLEDCWWAPGFLRPDGKASFLLWERAAPTGIIVDQAGERWVNEGTPYNTFGHLMLAASDGGRPCIPSWYVFDQHALDTYGFGGLRPGADPSSWVEAGALVQSDSIAGLADAVDAPALVETAARWNVLAEKGVDEDFGRGDEGSYERQLLAVFQRYPGIAGPHEWPNPSLAPLVRGPFYAGKVVLSDLGTKGGLVCDENARVLRPDGTAIPGLYACGNTMASMMGHAYPGPGACITPAMAFGALAADAMAAAT
ncbi:MAG: 3-ketosteroid-delta-dehydrogenase, partial [Frankiales bacterium]|nr:3-ketosteroid-delta-dehydrogenase [Frankiales bacterium]